MPSPRRVLQVAASSLLLAVFGSVAFAADPAPAPSLREQITGLFRQRNFTEAQSALEKLTTAEPGNAEAWHFLGQAHLARGDYEKSIAAHEKAIALDGAKADYHFQAGNAYGYAATKVGVFSKVGLAKKCKAAYLRAVELDPGHINGRWGILEYCRQAPAIVGGGMDEAYAQAAEIRKLDPVQGRRAYATLYTAEKKYAEAFALYDEALKEKPGDGDTLYSIGRLAAQSGEQLDRGLASLRELLTQPGRDRDPRVHTRIGDILGRKGDKAGARAAYEAALTLDPNLTQASEALKKL